MRVPLSWLAEYVQLTLPPEELAHRLTMAGVEAIFDPGPGANWDNVVVGHVLSIDPHPNADRLRLATVNIGDDTETVVCGAPNVAVGQRIAFAKVGANLIDGHSGEPMELKVATIRGVVSAGMVCSSKELSLSGEHEGILVLDGDAPVGMPFAEYMPTAALDIEITANRGDCLSMLGIAHEVAAITGQAVSEPLAAYEEAGNSVGDDVTVQVDDPDLCYRYTATVVHGLKVGPSPRWMQQRLQQAGQRPINNVVDVTNYVMLEYGQPLHAFDLSKVKDATVVVRSAKQDEEFTTLDGETHKLRPPMLVIADSAHAIGVAGVMGGLNSEMSESTSDLLLESATFSAINTRRTAAGLKLRTEASLRFEKGLNPELALRALRRATALVLETAGGTACVGVSDTAPSAFDPPKILFTQSHMRRVLGDPFPQPQVIRVLRLLGFYVGAVDEDKLLVSPPYWRTDIAIEEDVIEEVARTIGYDLVAEKPLAGEVPSMMEESTLDVREEVRDLLVQAGLQEIISYTLVSHALLEQVGAAGDGQPGPLRTVNPMSREQEYVRTSLRGTLLRNAAVGLRQTPGTVSLFEIGRIFIPCKGDLPEEKERVVGVLTGSRGDSLWDKDSPVLDFYEAKGVVQMTLQRLGVTASFERGSDDMLHPGKTARILANGREIGILGELHPRILSSFDLSSDTVALFEMDIDAIAVETKWLRHRFATFSRYPSAERDLALVVDSFVTAEQLQSTILNNPLVVRVALFDVFEGEGLAVGQKSLAYRLSLQSHLGTLTNEQVNTAISAIVQDLRRATGATLRA
jgi:phenylalanyl-tRNA synthetase beta chain